MMAAIRYAFAGAMLVVIVYYLSNLVPDRLELQKVRAEQQRLEGRVGRLHISEPSNISMVCIENSGPTDVAWRVRLPADLAWSIKHRLIASGGGSSSHVGKRAPHDILIHFRLLEDGDGWRFFLTSSNGSAANTLPSRIGKFLQRHWDELSVSVAGDSQQLNVDADRVVALLSIDVPEPLMPRAREELGNYVSEKLKTEPLLEIEIGATEAFEKREQQLEAENAP